MQQSWTDYWIAMSIMCAAIMLLVLSAPASANIVATERTEASILSDVSAIHAHETFWVALHIKMQSGWHTYWKNPGDSGMAPDVNWTLPKGFTAGELQFPAPDRMAFGDMVDYGYENDAWLLTPVTAPTIVNGKAVSILALKARWLVCKDICIPETGEFALSLSAAVPLSPAEPSPDAGTIDGMVGRLPSAVTRKADFYVSDNKIYFSLPVTGIALSSIKNAEFFPGPSGFIINNAAQEYKANNQKIHFTLEAEKVTLPGKANGVVSLFLDNGMRKDFTIELQQAAGAPNSLSDVLKAVVFALIGGLILNLMPCVFPILSFKALAIVRKAAKHPREIKAHGFAYTAGVIVSFIALAAVLIAVQQSGRSIGWGYQMQSPTFVAILTVIFFFVGLNLSGFYEMPALFGNFGGAAAAQDNLFGSFITGMLAVLVATPCTAPFMAPAVGFALTQEAMVVILVFISLGVGLALPFLLISLFPSLVSCLPKPGEWILTLRQTLAFPLYLSAVWLFWILVREVGGDVAIIVLLGIIFLVFALWLNKFSARSTTFLALLVATASIFAMIQFMRITPPAAPAEVNAESFSTARLDALRKEGKAVFVDATADWCITCKVNESFVLSSRKIHNAFAGKHITYMIADWTHGDKEITRYLQSFGRAGVPIYVYYPPGKDPIVLPQVLTKSLILNTIK